MLSCYPHGCISFASLPFSALFQVSSSCVDCMHQYCTSVSQCWHFLFVPFCNIISLSSVYISYHLLPWMRPLSCFIFFLSRSFCLFHLSICPTAGIPKTQSPSSTISSLKKPLVSMSLPAAPTMLGTLMMRRTRTSLGSPPLHPCHQACTLHPHRPRYLQDIIFITEQSWTLNWSEINVNIRLCFHSATAESGWWHRNWGIPQAGISPDRSSKPPGCAGGGHRVPACQRQGC